MKDNVTVTLGQLDLTGYMTVKQVIEQLQKYDGNKIIIISKDEEGNGYLPLRDIDDNVNYDKETNEIHLEKLTEELVRIGWTEEDVSNDGLSAICLWS